MPYMYLQFSKKDEALKKYYDYYINRLKVAPIVSITGGQFMKTGAGKSYTALRLGEQQDKDFNVNKVVYTPSEFLDVVDYIENEGRPSQVLVVDEGEITAPAQMYYSFMNRAISYTLSTFRYLRCMAIFITPSFSWIDKRIRQLTLNWGFTVKKYSGEWDKELKDNRVYLKLYEVHTDLFGDRTYMKRIRMWNTETKKKVILNRFLVKMPSEDLVIEYEKKARAFKEGLRKEVIKEIDKYNKYSGKKDENAMTVESILERFKEEPDLMTELVNERGRITTDMIQYKFPELTQKQVRILRNLIEKMWKSKK